MSLNRRQIMLAAGSALLGQSALGALRTRRNAPAKKVLFFTKSSGFQHSVIARNGNSPALAERILTEIGKEHGFEVVASKDGRMFDPDQIGQWDAFAFETTGDLTQPGTDKTPPISADGLKAFFDAIESGKGFVGMHCATDTFGDHRKLGADDPYTKMIGGHFAGHGAQQQAVIGISNPEFPGVSAFGTESFRLIDEWYGQKYLADDLHVILVQRTEGMMGRDYQRPNYPATWARLQGKGRVFYTSMGHREDVWENPKYQGLLLGALGWATGQTDIDVTPNVSKVTPGYKELPQK
ncbi:ThuA domain-containing protein [Tundrisphaera lichenicola]|uniref:ThuA domain-containing protein n=1 Tax=Tundrisphaera lichenicola TaxID=2029860 RepID=UPI003EB7F770